MNKRKKRKKQKQLHPLVKLGLKAVVFIIAVFFAYNISTDIILQNYQFAINIMIGTIAGYACCVIDNKGRIK